MPGYVIADVEVRDPEGFQEYRQKVGATIEAYHGRFLVRGGQPEVPEGEGFRPQRMVVLEFPTLEQAKRWYYSPEYQALVPLRIRDCYTGFVAIVGD